eukprot:4157867-Karenia_brevis.AAC.1
MRLQRGSHQLSRYPSWNLLCRRRIQSWRKQGKKRSALTEYIQDLAVDVNNIEAQLVEAQQLKKLEDLGAPNLTVTRAHLSILEAAASQLGVADANLFQNLLQKVTGVIHSDAKLHQQPPMTPTGLSAGSSAQRNLDKCFTEAINNASSALPVAPAFLGPPSSSLAQSLATPFTVLSHGTSTSGIG